MVFRDIVKVLKKAGWREVAVKGSHHQFKDSTGKKAGKATVADHGNKDLPLKTLKSIERQTGLSLRGQAFYLGRCLFYFIGVVNYV